MNIAEIESHLKYITNSAGDKTEVVLPVEIWNEVLNLLPDFESGLAVIDEDESKEAILSDLRESLRQVAAGQTYPVAELWDGIDD